MRREQQRRERRRLALGGGVLVVILAAIVVAVVIGLSNNRATSTATKQIIPSTPTGKVTVQSQPAKVPNPTDIKGVIAYDTKGYPAPGKADKGTLIHDHVQGPVKYAVIPPVGGPHNGAWMNAGVYTKPVPSEHAVHDLEHGAVWITYRPDLPAAQVKQLTDFVGKQSTIDEGSGQANRFMDLSPWKDDSLPSPIVISSWGYQLRVDDASDPRLQKFVDTFRHNQTYTPEFGASVDGIPVRTGGQPAQYGGKLPNPAGSLNGQGM